jgi:(2Fe-2S) ferredoxin
MKQKTLSTDNVVLVCGKCAAKKLHKKMCRRVQDRKLKSSVKILKVKCLNACSKGPNLAVCPGNVLYSKVKPKDLDTILDDALEASVR